MMTMNRTESLGLRSSAMLFPKAVAWGSMEEE
jgi:hypothetical protein